jgi:hypothetical protein
MNLPKTVTNAGLRSLAAPDELFQVRILVRNQTNHADYVIRGKNRIARKYLAKYDEALRCHVIDVPLSVWMAGIAKGPYRDNDSVCHDVMGSRNVKLFPLVTLVVPFPGAEKRLEAFKAFEAGVVPPDAFSHDNRGNGVTPAAERMRKMRERKKQQAEAAALLQPS